MGDWHQFDGGRDLGQRGSEGGVILRDDEHPYGSRITLERGGDRPFSITCGIYGWMVHTRFFTKQEKAHHAFDEMKAGLVEILNIIPTTDKADAANMEAVSDAIDAFLERFP